MSSQVASHRVGKKLVDVIFGASGACNKAIKEHGAAKVTNATVGSIIDEDGKLACLPTMEKAFRGLDIADIAAYAPPAGLPAYLDSVINLTFADNKPEGYLAACSTAGGTGAIHMAIMNYSEIGDQVLTSDWFWGTYNVLCQEEARTLATYPLFDEHQNYNVKALEEKTAELLGKQDSLLLIINTPAHNPTGYSLTDEEWTKVLDICRSWASKGKKINLLVDIAYIDYAGEKNQTRRFMKQFGNLPDNIFVMFAFSMSKGYTMYGQRTGALIGLSSNEEIIEEFKNVTKYTGRATWSNVSRGAQTLLTTIQQDSELLAKFEGERDALYGIIRDRAAIFMNEAKECGLNALPYKAGFFISVPTSDSSAVCEKLHDDLIFAVPLKMGVRIAVCSVPKVKMYGMAAKVLKAVQAVEG
ncbi:MAG: aminotransferase class I/II-fold pyridoxal phosphate-dependent enzyme [Anaerovibrio sp.]|uniref:pyridoxal phosphate-dependent aminotransferase n=1 Tax=Anaerovibrio sp. TaxID=1872532 RepID=UPI0025CE4CD7|nr:aminotransferase class I/II-fold pyridoxal phosphate-dependent enzyme [Anaerovibrio sp.]MCR5175816.1 aminotransferase class I/II-fold pyridoxal phosphate-dependent enzyme [Anaerovibrio sp.]